MPVNEKGQEDIVARLSAMGARQEERLAKHRAEMFKLPYISLVAFPMEASTLELISKDRAEAARAVLFYKKGNDARMGTVNPERSEYVKLSKEVSDELGARVQSYVISGQSLRVALSRYRERKKVEGVARDEILIGKRELLKAGRGLAGLSKLGEKIGRISPTELLTTIVAGAVNARASDVHIDPVKDGARLRYRIDGVLQDVATFARAGCRHVLSRIKVLSRLKLNIHNVPQEGSFVLRVDGDKYDVRVSVLPGSFGEHVVMRMFNRQEGISRLPDLGMKEQYRQLIESELKQNTGMVLAAGPTGSGKTTTIVACINEVNKPELKIISLEDPIEYRLEGVEQTEVEADDGYTFAVGLRTILRQDPDVIFVGEMRDVETAETAVYAAMSGHLVFSTIHANDAPGVILRLVDMGVRPYVLAPAINLVIAQRLARVVCKHCAEEYKVEAKLRDHLREVMEGLPERIFDMAQLDSKNLTFVKPKGCDKCGRTGYFGRTGVFEMFSVKGEVEEMILQGADSNRIRAAAVKQGMITIVQDAYLKVFDKITTVEEVERITEE